MTTASNHWYDLSLDTSAEAAQFVLNRLQDSYGATVRFSTRMASPYEVDRTSRIFWVPTGLPWRTVHARLDRCLLFLTGGPAWAKEFPGAELPLYEAPVIPLRTRLQQPQYQPVIPLHRTP